MADGTAPQCGRVGSCHILLKPHIYSRGFFMPVMFPHLSLIFFHNPPGIYTRKSFHNSWNRRPASVLILQSFEFVDPHNYFLVIYHKSDFEQIYSIFIDLVATMRNSLQRNSQALGSSFPRQPLYDASVFEIFSEKFCFLFIENNAVC